MRIEANAFWDRYYRQLEGATVVQFVGVVPDELEEWIAFPTLVVRLKDGSICELEISQDPEGNGGGFIFGLPHPDDPI
jgi:hypothetical protein